MLSLAWQALAGIQQRMERREGRVEGREKRMERKEERIETS
jgi:hypothetical protein